MPSNSLHEIPDILIITGMAGSGRTQALHAFEDMGYFCIDNLPPRLILQLAELVGINTGIKRHLVVTCDLRSQGLFDELEDSLEQLRAHELTFELIFLDASDSVLMRRFDESRRRHPLQNPTSTLTQAIEHERRQLRAVRAKADRVIDTTSFRPQMLARQLKQEFSEISEQQLLEVHVFSFGFKYGMPPEADLMMDVRFLPNPYYDPKLRSLTGKDAAVADFVLTHNVTQRFMTVWFELLDTVMPGYVAEGKTRLSIGIGCTGGQHRSVALAIKTAEHLTEQGYYVNLTHRDCER